MCKSTIARMTGSGGETGPSLLDSDLVKRDKTGTEIATVIRNGRPEKGMPKFDSKPRASPFSLATTFEI